MLCLLHLLKTSILIKFFDCMICFASSLAKEVNHYTLPVSQIIPDQFLCTACLPNTDHPVFANDFLLLFSFLKILVSTPCASEGFEIFRPLFLICNCVRRLPPANFFSVS